MPFSSHSHSPYILLSSTLTVMAPISSSSSSAVSTTTASSTAVASTTIYPIITSSYDPSTTTNTTFVQANPSNFRAIVQQLTGPSSSSTSPSMDRHPSGQKPPEVAKSASGDLGDHGPAAFKLHERRQAIAKLENIKLFNKSNGYGSTVMVSPVSPLDAMGRGMMMSSPRTPMSPHEELEEKAIAEKGFYLHPVSPLGTHQPQLLPLFPLHSPREN
ncbi:hypothetical protein Dimus_027851 [Dionaea muscipula]